MSVLLIFGGCRCRCGGFTRGKRLLELLGLVVVFEDEGVEVSVASDLELGLVGGLVLLYPRSWGILLVFESHEMLSSRRERTGGILAAGDGEELLDVVDFARHGGRDVSMWLSRDVSRRTSSRIGGNSSVGRGSCSALAWVNLRPSIKHPPKSTYCHLQHPISLHITPEMVIQLSETDKTRLATDTAESFTDAFYTALTSARQTLATFYVPVSTPTPGRTLPHICYNGDVTEDASEFQIKFNQMPFTFYEVQSLDAHVLNPSIDPEAAKTQKDAERNCSISVQVSGYVRLMERKDGPIKGFADHLVLVPNKESVGGRGTGKTGEGRQWLIQTQNFRFVV